MSFAKENERKPGNRLYWSKTSSLQQKQRTAKGNLPLNDPLIRSLDRKTTRKHTSHHYLMIYTKNTGNGSLKVLWWVLTTHTHSGKLLDHDPKNEASSQKRKKNWTSCYLNAQQVRLASQPEDRTKTRACLHKELHLVNNL